MADPMTGNTLEQRAAEIWQFVQDARVAYAGQHASGTFNALGEKVERLQDEIAALRLSAGADGWTLELYRDRDGELGVWAKQEGGSRVWVARVAAPRHETGEGS